MLATGDKAPLDVPLTNQAGDVFTLRDFAGSYVVVYFYPRDLTPGCAIEAEEFRDLHEDLTLLHAHVLGVSKDSCTSHQKFIERKQLPFTLVADEQHTLAEAFGVWGERKFMGRTYMGMSRSTFLIDPHGTIVHVWEKVTPKKHAEEVLAVLSDMQKLEQTSDQ
jgi:peroxiredoxin Q/BCP